MWTKSACVMLAWGIFLTLVAVGMGSARPAQANIRIASSTQVTLISTLSVVAPSVTAASPAARYVVQPGDTLSGIAAALAVHGGWPALYAANRRVIGPDPNAIQAGTVLVLPRPASSEPRVAGQGRSLHLAPPAAVPGNRHRPPTVKGAPPVTGMPQWLKTVLLAASLLIGAAFLAEPVLMIGRRRREAAPQAARRSIAEKARIILADHERLIVTHSKLSDTVYVLRPPGEDPKAILRVARLVLAEGPYRALAEQLGLPASWPIVIADHDRLVVAHSKVDDTVYVLRPPGEDPKAILLAARLVLPEDPYEELADYLGVSANWPLDRALE